VGVDWQSAEEGTVQFRAYGGPQLYDQTFSSIAPDRNSESLTRIQRVPAQQAGGSVHWSRRLGSKNTLIAGLQGQDVKGASDELAIVQDVLSSAIGAGGRQQDIGFHAEDVIRVTPGWLVTAAVRFDSWRNQNGYSVTTPVAKPGPVTEVSFPERSEHAFSPRLGMVGRMTNHLTLRASVYRAFRAPTLNELYRSFRLGNVVTQANDALSAERLTGGEAGASYSALGGRLTLRGSLFGNVISNPIANVTLDVQPNLIIRQRQNLGSTRQRGLELDFQAFITGKLTVSGGYQFVDSVVRSFPVNPVLEGLLIPHVPRNAFTFQSRYSDARFLTFGLQGRFVGREFDDDQNLLLLNRCFTLDAFVSHPLGQHWEIFAAGENLFNQRCDVGRTPVLTVGPPLLARVGLRFHLR
jgi:outer membrane receptor protein involved in Fe transport